MGWGKYTNEELGINRNITCSMFTSNGADVECATYSEQQLAKARRQYAGLLKEAAAAKEQARKLEKKLASAPDEQVATIKSEILRFRQDVVDKIAEKLNAAIKSQTNLSECKASREVYQEYSQTCDVLSSLTSEILKRETKIKKKQRQANRKMSNDIDEAKDVECFLGGNEKGKVSEFCLFNYLERHFGYHNYQTMEAMIEHHVDLIMKDYARQGRSVSAGEIRQKAIASLKSLTKDACDIFDRGSNGHCVPEVDKRDFNAKLEKAVDKIMKRKGKKGKGKTTKMSNADNDGLDVQCFTVQELAREKDKEAAVYHVFDAFEHDDPGEFLDDIKTEKALAKAQREYERDTQRIYAIANRNLQALQKEAEAEGATRSKEHYVWLAGELKKQYEKFQRFTQRAYKERLAELKSAQSKSMSNDFDVQCSVGRWDSREAAEHGLSILSGYIEKQMRKGANVQQLTQNVRSRISEGLNEMAKAGCSDRDRKAAAKACDRILETLRARGAKCAMRSLDDVFNESDKVCEDHIRAILQDVKEARRTVKGWAGTSEGAKVNYKLQAKYREGAKDLLNRIKKRGQASAAKLSQLEMMIQQICGITAHTEWEFQRIVKEQQK